MLFIAESRLRYFQLVLSYKRSHKRQNRQGMRFKEQENQSAFHLRC